MEHKSFDFLRWTGEPCHGALPLPECRLIRTSRASSAYLPRYHRRSIRYHQQSSDESLLVDLLPALHRFRKCQMLPVLLTANEEPTLNEFHRRRFVGGPPQAP
ncbi:uncharacterized protein LOC142765083 [Rhipicephalus microplus]|uniref:uncharacterized protein LOC142765083 n=1 Tax=Rhipicephalus microplus TaxID=6941 RepID=UPI003F6BB5A6